MSSATVGSKLLVQVFGAPEWALTYVDLTPHFGSAGDQLEK